jgi:hypothetical protein
MYIFLSVLVLCATFIWFSIRYIQPYSAPTPEQKQEDVEEDDASKSMDELIQGVYDYLDGIDNGKGEM